MLMSELMLRNAREADREAVLRMTLAAFGQYEAVMGRERWVRYRSAIEATLAEFAGYECVMVERDGELLGSVLLFPPGHDAYGGQVPLLDFPEVRLLAVDPGARGQGVGLALMEECMRRVQAAGAKQLGLHTNEMMEGAKRLYARMGFRRAPESDFSPAAGVLVEGYVVELEAQR